MKMCLAPCYKGCSDERYSEESAAVERFLATRGESRLVQLRSSRDEASANLEFEAAATLHSQVQKAEAVRALAPELVRPLSQLRAVILQASANPDEVSVFLFDAGCLRGPLAFSTLGMRIQNEQSGSSSLYAQPMALEPTLESPDPVETHGPNPDFSLAEHAAEPDRASAPATEPANGARSRIPRTVLEVRMEAVLADLGTPMDPPDPTLRQGHLALLKRWYYRPEAKRPGEIFFPGDDGRWPIRALLRGAGRIAAKSLTGAGAS
jgi:excinuclease ABC subunit C